MKNGPQHEPLSFGESLSKLRRLSAQTLHETSARVRSDLSGAEWKMGLCLLASVRENRFRQLSYANITQYAEEALGMSGKKAGSLLAIARLLEHLPLCAAAFRNGEIDWCKLRALQSVLTPETEQQWLDYARCHRTNEVEKKVAMAPKDWKRQGGMAASIAGHPIATVEEVADILDRPAVHQIRTEAAGAETGAAQAREQSKAVPESPSEESPTLNDQKEDNSEPASALRLTCSEPNRVIAESPRASAECDGPSARCEVRCDQFTSKGEVSSA